MSFNGDSTNASMNYSYVMQTKTHTAADVPQNGKENTHRKVRRRKANKVRRVVDNVVYENGIYTDHMDLGADGEDLKKLTVAASAVSPAADRSDVGNIAAQQYVGDDKRTDVSHISSAAAYDTPHSTSHGKPESVNYNATCLQDNLVNLTCDNMEAERPGHNRTHDLCESDHGITKNKFKQMLDTNGNIYSRSNDMGVAFDNNTDYSIKGKAVNFKYNYVLDLADKALDLSTKRKAEPDDVHQYNCDLPESASSETTSSSRDHFNTYMDTPVIQLVHNAHKRATNHLSGNIGGNAGDMVSYHSIVKGHSKSKHKNGELTGNHPNVNDTPVSLDGINSVQAISGGSLSSYRKLINSRSKPLSCDSPVAGKLGDIDLKEINLNKNGFHQNLALINNIPPTSEHLSDILYKPIEDTQCNVIPDPAMAFMSPKVHVCKICLCTFHLRKDLIAHIRTHPFKKHECSVCHRFFNEIGNLRQHMRVHDADDMPHECLTCQRKFRHKSTLNNHVKTHTNERPYTCPVCSKGFKIANGLTTHMRKHTGEAPYSCDHCEKTFRNYSNLQQHQFQHNGVRKFQCTICLAKFSRKSILDNHVSKLHPGASVGEHTRILPKESDNDTHQL